MPNRSKLLILLGVILVAIGLVTLFVQTPRNIQPSQDNEINQVKNSVERVLSTPPPGGYAPIPKGVRLLSVSRDGDLIKLDFSRELLSNGTGSALEDALHQILTAASNASASGNKSEADYEIFIEGRPLQSYLR